jgi:hypothetical protein
VLDGEEPSALAGLEDLLAVARLLELAVVQTTVLLEPSDPTEEEDDDNGSE